MFFAPPPVKRGASLVFASLLLSVSAHADLIVGLPPAPNSISFTDGGISNCSAAGTTGTDAGFSITTDGAACLPYTGGLSFVDNGQWFSLPALIDTSGTTTLTIKLGGTYSAVWGFMNYALVCPPDFGECSYGAHDPTVTALDINKNVLETHDIAGFLNGSSSGDVDFLAGDTVGISRSTSDIAYLQIGGDNIAMTNISLSGSTPEPSTITLFAFAAGMIVWRLRTRRA